MTSSLHQWRKDTFSYSYICKKVETAKTSVTPERLPPTNSATIHHARRTYLQGMVWMGCSENMEPTKWGLDLQGDKLIPVMMDNTPAPDVLLQMIHCNCVGGCNTMRCSCKKYGLECTAACGSCKIVKIWTMHPLWIKWGRRLITMTFIKQ